VDSSLQTDAAIAAATSVVNGLGGHLSQPPPSALKIAEQSATQLEEISQANQKSGSDQEHEGLSPEVELGSSLDEYISAANVELKLREHGRVVGGKAGAQSQNMRTGRKGGVVASLDEYINAAEADLRKVPQPGKVLEMASRAVDALFGEPSIESPKYS